jgi:hypothetical protein
VVARRGGAREPGSGRQAALRDRIRERPGAGDQAGLGQAVGRDQPGRLEQVGQELGRPVRRDSGPGGRVGAEAGRLVALEEVTAARAAKRLTVVGLHLRDLSARGRNP